MKNLKLFLWIAIFCTSCSTSKFLTSDVKPFEITEMLKIEPFSYISLIEKGNQGFDNDSISKIAKDILNESLKSFSGILSLSPEEIVLTDLVDREQLEEDLRIMIESADNVNNVQNIKITPFLESLMNESDKRFGLIIVQIGFTRTRGNYVGQYAKGVGIGILTGLLTGYSYYQTPIKANSTLYAMIIDNQNKNVAFYNKSFLQNREPIDKENIIKQIDKVFKKYFW